MNAATKHITKPRRRRSAAVAPALAPPPAQALPKRPKPAGLAFRAMSRLPVIVSDERRAEEDRLIAEYIAKHGVTRCVTFGEHQPIVDAARDLGLEVYRLQTGQKSQGWALNGLTMSAPEFYRRVNQCRRARGLEEIPMPRAIARQD